jgi:hypothetical protein
MKDKKNLIIFLAGTVVLFALFFWKKMVPTVFQNSQSTSELVSTTESPILDAPTTESPDPPQFIATIKYPSLCYSGPGQDYDQLPTSYQMGTKIDVLGINSEGRNWFNIKGINPNENCWIEITSVDFDFDISYLEIIETAKVNQNSKCRYGPDDTIYNHVAFVYQGEEVIVKNRNADMDWLLVENPPDYKGECWIYLQLLDYHSNLSILSVATNPPPPLVVLTNTPKSGGDGGGGSETTSTPPPSPEPTPTPCQWWMWWCK